MPATAEEIHALKRELYGDLYVEPQDPDPEEKEKLLKKIKEWHLEDHTTFRQLVDEIKEKRLERDVDTIIDPAAGNKGTLTYRISQRVPESFRPFMAEHEVVELLYDLKGDLDDIAWEHSDRPHVRVMQVEYEAALQAGLLEAMEQWLKSDIENITMPRVREFVRLAQARGYKGIETLLSDSEINIQEREQFVEAFKRQKGLV